MDSNCDKKAFSTGENAGGVLIYLEDSAEIERVAAWLMEKDYVGPLLATEMRGVSLPAGTLPLSCLGMEGPRAPDIAFSMVRKRNRLFLSFPYVCPEPVLVKCSV